MASDVYYLSSEQLSRELKDGTKSVVSSVGISCLELIFSKSPLSMWRQIKTMLYILESGPIEMTFCNEKFGTWATLFAEESRTIRRWIHQRLKG